MLPALDQEGFLCHLDDWNESVAGQLAARESLTLTKAHWEIIRLVREFYQRYEHSPEMRPLVKFTRQQLGIDKGQSVYLLSLFPGSPAKLACKIAGLPRPANCL
jgi:tRNA 2-thiouridine synthesizing protein E